MDEDIHLLATIYHTKPSQIQKRLKETAKKTQTSVSKVLEMMLSAIPFLLGLPDEILVQILSHLQVKDFLRFCQTSKTYHPLCDDRPLWDFFLKRDYDVTSKEPRVTYQELFLRDFRKSSQVSMTYRHVYYLKKGHIVSYHKESQETQKFREPKDFSVQISSGTGHVGVVTLRGEIYMWGKGRFGNLGGGTDAKRVPTRTYFGKRNRKHQILNPEEDPKMAQLSCYDDTSIALSHDGQVYSWGYNGQWQLGAKNPLIRTYPKLVTLPLEESERVIHVECGDGQAGAITSLGNLYLWGKAACRHLGIKIKDYKGPFKVDFGDIRDKIVQVSFSDYHTGAVTNRGILYMWGSNRSFEIQAELPSHVSKPTVVHHIKDVQRVACGHLFTVVLTTDGILYRWGKGGHYGGLEPYVKKSIFRSPAPVDTEIEYVMCRKLQTLVVDLKRKIFLWGADHTGVSPRNQTVGEI